jgi:PAS domain S-box-containing protein
MHSPEQPEQQLEEQFKIIADTAPVLIWISGPDKLCYFFNTGWLNFTGRTMGEESGNGWAEGVHPDDLERCLEIYTTAFDARRDFRMEYRLRRHDGEYRWLVDKGVPRYLADGTFAGYIGSCMDIDEVLESERVKSELLNAKAIQTLNQELTEANKELSLTQERLEHTAITLNQAIESASIGTWEVDLATDELTLSQRTKEIHGMPAEKKLTLTDSFEMILPEHRDRIIRLIDEAVKGAGQFAGEYTIQPTDNDPVKWLRATGKVIYEAGKAKSISGTLIDITEQKQDDQRKNDFIGMVSHELKTPLTSLMALVQMLKLKAQTLTDPFIGVALEKANIQVKKMTTMVNGFLNVSRFESGKIQIHKQKFDLEELVREVIEEAKLTISSHEIRFVPCQPVEVLADRDKIASVIINLISNAVKYSPAKRLVELKCGVTGNQAEVSVRDEGIGIKPEDRDKLFDRFYRVNNPGHFSGFGIGLYLSAEIIMRHNGRIWVDSEYGVGSTFYFSLPVS